MLRSSSSWLIFRLRSTGTSGCSPGLCVRSNGAREVVAPATGWMAAAGWAAVVSVVTRYTGCVSLSSAQAALTTKANCAPATHMLMKRGNVRLIVDFILGLLAIRFDTEA